MNKTIKILSVTFVVQLLVIIALNMSSGSNSEQTPVPLVDKSALASMEIVIRGSEGETKLTKTENGWTLPDYGNLPASDTKVQQLLETLAETKVSWPVASSSAAAERFEVGEKNAQKTLLFNNNGKTEATLYLGTSPGYRKAHARLGDDADIFVVELAQHDVPEKAESWLKKNLLSVEGDITKIATEAFSLAKGDDAWTIDSLPAGETLDTAKAETWVKHFNNILVNRLVEGKDQIQSVVIQNPVFTATVSTSAGDTNYAFYEKADKWYVKTFGDTPLFEIAKYQAQPMIDITLDGLITQPDESVQGEEANAPAL